MHTLVIAETPSNAYKTPEIMPSPQSEQIFMHIAASENSFKHVPDSTMDSAPASRKPGNDQSLQLLYADTKDLLVCVSPP
mgnify:FL=1